MGWFRKQGFRCNVPWSLIVGIALLIPAPAMGADDARMKRMEEILQKQQAHIETQARVIEKLQEQVDNLTDSVVKEATEAAKVEAESVARAEVREISRHKDTVSHEVDDKLSLSLYGWIAKALMVSDDGNSTDYYVVDPGYASSRIGALGKLRVNDDITVGTRLEFDYDHNRSSSVNQENKNNVGDGKFRDRWVDLQAKSERFGKFYIGKGSTASDGSAESDLSGTTLVSYGSVTDFAGGLLFYDKNADVLSNVAVFNVFNHFDGLGRDDRIRYDSPKFSGFQLGGSVTSGNGGDVALRYAAKLGEGFKFAAAAAWSDPQGQDSSVDNRYSSSASMLHSSGFSLSLTGTMQELDDNTRDDPTFIYTKIGYRRNLFSFGESRFSVDYGRNDNVGQDNDEATALGFQFVQDIPKWGSEYFVGYRQIKLDRDNTDYDDLQVIQSGWRLKF